MKWFIAFFTSFTFAAAMEETGDSSKVREKRFFGQILNSIPGGSLVTGMMGAIPGANLILGGGGGGGGGGMAPQGGYTQTQVTYDYGSLQGGGYEPGAPYSGDPYGVAPGGAPVGPPAGPGPSAPRAARPEGGGYSFPGGAAAPAKAPAPAPAAGGGYKFPG